jgi:type I restriction enzyme S subunit
MRMVRLGDVCQQVRESVKPGVHPELRYIGLESIESGSGMFAVGELSKTPGTPMANSFRFGPEHVLYGKLRPYLNKVALPDFEGKCSTEIIPLLPNPDIEREYLAYFLRSGGIVDLISSRTAGARMPRADMDFIFSLPIPLPSLPEQRRIVDLLSRTEGIVRLRRETEKKAAELIPALFLDMFGDPAMNSKGWAKMLLGDLCSRITDGTHQPPPFQESGIPFIFVANIVRGELTLNASKFISEETYTELTKRCPIERDDVLYSTVGSFGVPVKVDTDERFSFQRHIAHLKPYRDRLDSDFLVGMLSTPALKGQADAAARGIAQKTINLGEIRKFQVIAPPIEEQKRFAVQVEAARSIQSQQATATAKAQATFDALLARAFSR